MLISKDIVPPKTHDIEQLLDLVTEHIAPIPSKVRDSAMLSRYAIVSRYAADLGEIDEDEWNETMSLARAVLSWAKTAVQGTP